MSPEANWLEPLLARELQRVRAPEVRLDRKTARVRRISPLVVCFAGLLVAAALLWGFRGRSTSGQSMALAALDRDPAEMELRSESPAEIRGWVKANTGLDIALPDGLSRAVRLAGACVVPGRGPVAAISCQINGHRTALLVSKAAAGEAAVPGHRFLKTEMSGGVRVSAWVMGGESYTLAYAGSASREECAICHAAVLN